jgi:hypothetical protein
MRPRLVVLLGLSAALLAACASVPIPQNPPISLPRLRVASTPTSTSVPIPTETAPPPEPLTGCVVGGNLRVRSEPTTASDILGGLMIHQCVTVHATNFDHTWGSITADDLAGWVSLKYLDVAGSVESLPIAGEYSLQTVDQTQPVEPEAAPSLPPPAPDSLACVDTFSHIGEFVSCTVREAYCDYMPDLKGAPTVCSELPAADQLFTLRVWDADWSDLDGRCLVVYGLVENHAGKPEIVVDSRSQLSDCE